MNRQQFDNYIKGKNLPNEGVIERICTYFQVDLAALFRDNTQESPSKGISALIDKHKKQLDRIISSEISARGRGLVDGLYYIFFAIPNDSESFACSLLAVRREGGLTTFKRITRLKGMSGSFRSMTTDIHSGVVIYRDGLAFFVGLDTTHGRYPSILIATPVTSREIIYFGESLISAGIRFDVTKFCISPISNRTTAWKAMRQVSFISAVELETKFPKIYLFLSK